MYIYTRYLRKSGWNKDIGEKGDENLMFSSFQFENTKYLTLNMFGHLITWLILLFSASTIKVRQQSRLSFNPKKIPLLLYSTHGIEWWSDVAGGEKLISEKCNDCFQNDCKLVCAQIKDQIMVLIKGCKIPFSLQFSLKWHFCSVLLVRSRNQNNHQVV